MKIFLKQIKETIQLYLMVFAVGVIFNDLFPEAGKWLMPYYFEKYLFPLFITVCVYLFISMNRKQEVKKEI